MLLELSNYLEHFSRGDAQQYKKVSVLLAVRLQECLAGTTESRSRQKLYKEVRELCRQELSVNPVYEARATKSRKEK